MKPTVQWRIVGSVKRHACLDPYGDVFGGIIEAPVDPPIALFDRVRITGGRRGHRFQVMATPAGAADLMREREGRR